MPPWFADPAHGKWMNDRSLSKQELETLVAWVDSGAHEGDAKDAPAPKQWTTGWGISKPDVVFEMPSAFDVPANAKVDYQYIVVPTNFTEDKWVKMVEARPSARSVVHHVVVYIREPGNPWLRGEAEPGVPFVPPKKTPEGKPREDIGGVGSDILTIYTPGNLPDMFRPGQAKLIKAGSDLVFQMHYTPTGKAASDKTSVGIVFATEPPKERVVTISATNTRFVIPPGHPNYRVPRRVQVRQRRNTAELLPAHASARQGFRVQVQACGRRGADAAARAELQLQLAAHLSSGESDSREAGRRDGDRGLLRQLTEQSVQSRSEGRGAMGRAELGRDGCRFHRCRRVAGD